MLISLFISAMHTQNYQGAQIVLREPSMHWFISVHPYWQQVSQPLQELLSCYLPSSTFCIFLHLCCSSRLCKQPSGALWSSSFLPIAWDRRTLHIQWITSPRRLVVFSRIAGSIVTDQLSRNNYISIIDSLVYCLLLSPAACNE